MKQTYAGWWFGTSILFSHILGTIILTDLYRVSGWWFGCHEFYVPMFVGNVIIPIDEVIFFRGVAKNHQPELQLITRLIGS